MTNNDIVFQEYNTEQVKVRAATNKRLMEQLNVMEDRNQEVDKISGKHETSVTALSEELIESHQKQSRVEGEADPVVLDTNSRLIAERDTTLKDRGASVRIETNIAQIQLNLECPDHLVEKSSKLNPVKLRKFQEEKIHMIRHVKNLTKRNQELEAKSVSVIKELEGIKKQNALFKNRVEVLEKTKTEMANAMKAAAKDHRIAMGSLRSRKEVSRREANKSGVRDRAREGKGGRGFKIPVLNTSRKERGTKERRQHFLQLCNSGVRKSEENTPALDKPLTACEAWKIAAIKCEIKCELE